MDPGILQIETVLLISLYMSILDLYFYLIFRARQLSKCVDGIAFLENFFLGASRIYLIGSEIFLYIGRQLILFFFFLSLYVRLKDYLVGKCRPLCLSSLLSNFYG